jgi:16S rRNA pseudouridine516 synthase
MFPQKNVGKKYFFWALGSISSLDIEKVEDGIYLEKGDLHSKPAKLEIYKEGMFIDFKNEIPIDSVYNNQPVVSGYITISEGKKHQVKRIIKEIGCYVIYLKRVSIGGLDLDESLEKGKYRELTEDERYKLFE